MESFKEYILENKEMLDFFIIRTNRHIDLVRKYCKKIADYDPTRFEELISQGEHHDASKLKEPEKTPYISITWRHKFDNYKSYKTPGSLTKEDENRATLHHILNNPHHPEYWLKDKSEASLNQKDRNKPGKIVDATLMNDIAIAEMVADWAAMGKELGNNPKDWADKNVNVRWKFNKHQVDLIYELIKNIWPS
jgi:hypothetical protein